jgi:hypothetical protein
VTQAPPQAPTMMAEAPRPVAQPAPRAQPVSPAQPVPQMVSASPSGPTTGGPQPGAPEAPMPTPMPQAPPRVSQAPQAPQAPPQAPTMMAEAPRAPSAPANHAGANATPPHGAGKANNQTGKKGAFRETAWFKRGEIEEEMAKAQAAVGDNALKSGVTGQHLPVDESQVDLSAQDRDRLSLKTGATQAMPVIKAPVQALPGDRMDEAEMLAELNPSRKYFLIAGAIVLAIVLGLVIYFATRPAPKAEAPAPDKPAPVAAAPPATAPPSTPPSAVAATPPVAKPQPPSPTPPAAPPSPSLYAAQVAKLEAKGGNAKEAKKLEKLVAQELKVAHKKKERALEDADRDLLARLKKLHGH